MRRSCLVVAPVRRVELLLAAVIAASPLGAAMAAAVADPLDRPALASTRVPNVFLDAVTRAGSRVVAVGERGVVLLSDDDGRHWHQVATPVSVTLTAVQFVTPSLGWAIGHGGVVLHSADGGRSWTRQADGRSLARVALDDATTKATGTEPGAAERLRLDAAQQLVDDGPDKPLLALSFRDPQHGIVAGAYGLIFATDDGGRSWRPWMERVENPKALHIYALARHGDDLYLAGEQGLLLRSSDAGKTFGKLTAPYRGTFFAIAVTEGGEVVLGGLRGNVFRSSVRGDRWDKAGASSPLSPTSLATRSDGSLVLANEAGQLLQSRDQGKSFEAMPNAAGSATAIVEAADGALVGVGPRGPLRFDRTDVARPSR